MRSSLSINENQNNEEFEREDNGMNEEIIYENQSS